MCTHQVSDWGKAETKPIKTTGSLCPAPVRYAAKLRKILNTVYFLFRSVVFWRAAPVRELNGSDQQVKLSSCRPVLSRSSWTSWTGFTGPPAGWCHCLRVILFREVTGSGSKWTVCYLKPSAAPASREHQTPPFGPSAPPLSRHSVFVFFVFFNLSTSLDSTCPRQTCWRQIQRSGSQMRVVTFASNWARPCEVRHLHITKGRGESPATMFLRTWGDN